MALLSKSIAMTSETSKTELVLHPDQSYNAWLKPSKFDIIDIENYVFSLVIQ